MTRQAGLRPASSTHISAAVAARSALVGRIARVVSVDAHCLPSAEQAGLRCGRACKGTQQGWPRPSSPACKGPQPRRGRLSEAGLPRWREPSRIEAVGPAKITSHRPWCVCCLSMMMADSTVSVGLSAARDRHDVSAGDGPTGRLADGSRRHTARPVHAPRALRQRSGCARALPSPSSGARQARLRHERRHERARGLAAVRAYETRRPP